jgi:hypothetical protein
MASSQRTSAKITKEAQRRLSTLVFEVERDFGVAATQESAMSALILDVSAAQLAGILLGYIKDKATPDVVSDKAGL